MLYLLFNFLCIDYCSSNEGCGLDFGGVMVKE
ncbi:hypothetical protein GLYMA_17G239850v4 [Glycine max]|nr:hypothetical protein GLYMA_17G239850v4 [Glycine max]KAH1119896.1 hypothetical protein GYH30_048315 [Glycine max]